MALRPFTPRQEELSRAPTVASQFPIVFRNGAQWTGYQGHCSTCKQLLPDHDLHGFVTRPAGEVARVEAIGWCERCQHWTPFEHRLHPDLSITGRDSTGRWSRWQSAAKPWWQRWLGQLRLSLAGLR